MPLTVVSTPAVSSERATIGVSSGSQFPGVGGSMDCGPEATRCEGIPLHLRLQPRQHWLGVGNSGLEELVLRTERVENHVAIGEQKAPVLARHAHRVRKDRQRIGFRKVRDGIELPAID